MKKLLRRNPWWTACLSVAIAAGVFLAVAFAWAQPGQPTVNLMGGSQVAFEGAGNAQVAVYLSGVSQNTVTVQYATANGTATAPADYASTTGTLTFTPGETSKSISVPLVNDGITEGD